MLHSSFPPKSQPRFSQRRAGLYVVKATAAFSLVLSLAAVQPAHAQGPGGYWMTQPCDAQGNPLTSPLQRNGFYLMDGTKSGTASNTYPQDWVASLGSNPTGGASPLTVTTIPTMQTYNGVGIAGYPTYGSFASNELGGGIYTYYTPTSSGLINGSVTTHIDGQLVYYFLVQWSGGGTPTVQMPKSISLLLNTNLFANVLLSYGSSKQTSGLSASASASDKAFNETASSTGPTYVCGYHLVQASVSALTATTGIAETYLNGSVDQTASDPIPAGAYVAGHGYQPPNGSSPAVANSTTASANSEVAAGVKLDSREVGISCPAMDSPFANNLANNYYKGAYDSQHGTDRYQHPRLLANNSVDSVVFQNNDPVSGQQFIAGATYDSGAAGFIAPKYTWSISGDGTPDANTSASLGPSPTNPYGLVNLPANLSFGSTWDTTTTKSSQFTVSVQDSDSATAADTYSVTWHTPAEKFRVLSDQQMVPKLVGAPQAIALNASVPSYLTIPGQEGEIDWGAAQQSSGLPVAVAGAGAGGALLIPEVASGPWGWAAIAFQAVAAGASYKLGMSSPDHPGTVQIQGNANYAEYVADVQHQIDTNTIPGDAGNMPCFLPQSLATQAQAAEQSPSGWTLDPYFLSCTATWQGGWYMEVKDLEGDSYGVNGYTGPVDGHTSVATALFKHFVWTCSYRPGP